MIDKPFYIIIAVYCMSVGFLTAQYVADSYGIALTAPDGTPLKSAIIDYVKVSNLNTLSSNVTSVNKTTSLADAVLTASFTAISLAWALFQVLTGFYIFNVLILFGINPIIITGITIVYLIFLARTLIALIRGF